MPPHLSGRRNRRHVIGWYRGTSTGTHRDSDCLPQNSLPYFKSLLFYLMNNVSANFIEKYLLRVDIVWNRMQVNWQLT